jgi:lysophospholipase L1-like esterase
MSDKLEVIEPQPIASQFEVPENVIAGGGGSSSASSNGSTITLDGTIGQTAAGTTSTSSNGQYSVSGGFWQAEPTAAPTPISYVALGDSLAVGVGATAGNGYVARYKAALESDTGATVNLDNRGVSGSSSSQLFSAVQSDANLRTALQNAQVITFDIGGIDLLAARATYKQNTTSCGGADNQNCLRTAVANFKTNWNGIIAALHSLNAAANTRTIDIYNPFVNVDKSADTFPNDGGLNDFEVFKIYLDQTNDHIRTTAQANGIALGSVYCSFNGVNGDIDPGSFGLIAGDGFHPNDTGHALIAARIRSGTLICSPNPNPPAPYVLIEDGTVNRAVALDSVTFVRGPFKVLDDHNFSADHHTRVIIFTSNLGLTQPNPAVLTVQASGFDLPVENVGALAGVAGLNASYIVVRLPDGLLSGDLSLTVTLNGNMSNITSISISP